MNDHIRVTPDVPTDGLHVSMTPRGFVNLAVHRATDLVLFAQVTPRPGSARVRAAHQLHPPTLQELDALRDAMVTLLGTAVIDPILAQLPTAPRVTTPTPWGPAETCTPIEPGVYHVTTERHGGYWIDHAVFLRLPVAAQVPGRWYEEDEQGALLAASLGWCANDPDRQAALRAVITRTAPELLPLIGRPA
ncbi:DUF7007 domain-containing protein [Deinococcus soli (ex Cha et al. 2016)]|uniref:DUF7007 domain-containing protein n=1 Tax=Deinococcus soli (ex Cha et al. 2016) TaxID=1309411 RepID=UPI001669EB24|nr:hypothetical protein [Deinococcus soli (ex Cha et al. 2016)]GGB79438.1 hypothetical protein GCM10008019_39580 [Deinococcus soli (ex Cha et al. 2016)]